MLQTSTSGSVCRRVDSALSRECGDHQRVQQLAMKPITFSCLAILPLSARELTGEILDLANWPKFQGYGPIPGIKAAEFEVKTDGLVGSRIRVTSRDGSTHVEEIVQWQPDQRIRLRMQEFSPPLSRLATTFDETWDFQAVAGGTKVNRSFDLHARSFLARLPLRMIAFFLRGAISRQLAEMGTKT